jgi:hypothetical protein
MNRRLIVRLEAEADITNGAVWYESRESGLGLQLISEVHSAIARALKNPESFTGVRRNPTVRRVLTRRFPYRIFFNSRFRCASRSTTLSSLETPCRTRIGSEQPFAADDNKM